MTREEEIRAIGRRAGARVVGIASAAAFRAHVPDGYSPEDILPGAKSVVVAGGDGPTAGAWRCPDHRVMEITGYDLRENVAVHAMCDHIEGNLGYYAIQAPSLPVHGHEPPMSMMLAAELAGLGSRSLAAHIILNPEYGLLYYAALITTLPLEPDPPLEKPACPHPGCSAMYKRIGTTPCLRVCPACLSGTVKDGAIETSTYNRERCHTRSQTYGIGSFQKSLLQIVNEDDPERRRTMIYSDFFTKSTQAVGFFRDSIAQCFECMRVCPVGRKYRKLQ
jgi:epoxyqueuosine reductase